MAGIKWPVASQWGGNMSLTLLIDQLVSHIDRKQLPFDVTQFEALDRAVCVEADSLGLSDHMPRHNRITQCRGCTNLPVGPKTQHDPPGYYYPMPSQIPEWRSQMLTLRALAEQRTISKTESA